MNVTIHQPDGTACAGTEVRTDDGKLIDGVRTVAWRHEAGQPPVAEVELYLSELSVSGQLIAYVGSREIRRIEFADGEVVEYPRAEVIEVTHMGSVAREFVAR